MKSAFVSVHTGGNLAHTNTQETNYIKYVKYFSRYRRTAQKHNVVWHMHKKIPLSFFYDNREILTLKHTHGIHSYFGRINLKVSVEATNYSTAQEFY